jgi:hypothetical protein
MRTAILVHRDTSSVCICCDAIVEDETSNSADVCAQAGEPLVTMETIEVRKSQEKPLAASNASSTAIAAPKVPAANIRAPSLQKAVPAKPSHNGRYCALHWENSATRATGTYIPRRYDYEKETSPP